MGAKRGRSLGLDVARGLGIALVFYGHFMEKLAGAGSDPAQLQWKWVYAFHMPLFFFLAGIFWRPRRAGPARWLGGKLRARLLPVASFSALLLPLWFWMLGPSPEWRMLLEAYLYGQPTLDWATWFLVCLLMVECWIALLSALLPLDRRGGLAIAVLASLLFGVEAINQQLALAQQLGLPANTWFVLEAVIASPFYLVGLACRPWLTGAESTVRDALLGASGGALLFFTFDANTGFARESVVVMATGNHGLWLAFYATAFAGIVFAVSLCRLLAPALAPLAEVGRVSVLYLGFAGLNFTFVESPLVGGLGWLPRSHGGLLLYGAGYVAVSLVCFYPLSRLLRRYAAAWFGLSTPA